MNKYTISLLLSFVWLTVCGVTCHPVDEESFELCDFSSICTISASSGYYVTAELYKGDSLIMVSGGLGWTNVSSDISAVDDTLTLRLSIYCNGQWIQGDDYTFIDKMDSVFHISYGSSIENGVDIFSEEQKKYALI